MVLAVDTIDESGLSNKMRHQFLMFYRQYTSNNMKRSSLGGKVFTRRVAHSVAVIIKA